MPWDEDEGLSWAPPFIFADPAVAVGHPSAIVDGEAIDCWVELQQGTRRVIARLHAPSFAAGFGAAEEVLAPQLPWHDGAVDSPAVVAGDGGKWLFYRSAGRLGLAWLSDGGATLRADPFHGDGDVVAVAAARLDRSIWLAVLIDDAMGGRVIELVDSDAGLRAALDGAAPTSQARETGVRTPSWASRLLDVGLRIERTPAGRARQDLLLTAALPSVMDFGAQPAPSAVGVATRYLDPEQLLGPFLQPELPILTGPPYPQGATAIGYQGGVLVLFAARSGPRDAIAVARHP